MKSFGPFFFGEFTLRTRTIAKYEEKKKKEKKKEVKKKITYRGLL